MTPDFVVALTRQSVETILLVTSPMMISAVVVGLLISIFQAATQIQEQTLSFAPKVAAVMVALTIFAPWIIKIVLTYTEEVLRMAVSIGGGG
ncbi:flagellar biosynthesis protein FliQ [Desulfohalobium retbaense]|uniref:Flagellar biosynthetic protein FliQ n=1 Tax=Desulfohalobium retbaense (strain ATCC 49708 / DSM 5692 / JCM 16813 / HR100) TaxID=485915 RepID=C8WYW6_DESRD|nr:flagellar biosynthesis protein FliQ [Desulfohalobium retbaense]ACV67882.1 flagellar biosynthetic protein FliQ [Desulfohalobium retbaense DSM 5692]